MAKITGLTPQKNNTRVNLYLDDKFYCGLELEAAVKCRLKTGMDVEPEKLAVAIADSENTSAFNRALKYVSGRLKTERDVRTYLSGKKYTEQAINNCIEKLKSYRYIDNEYYAARFAESSLLRGGKNKIRYELKAKGVEESYIEDSLSNIPEEAERESASKTAEKYMRNKEPTRENYAKLYRFLYSKGYSRDIIKSVAAFPDDEN